MFKNLKWLRIVPDKPGKGGHKTGYHSFQAQPVNDTRRLEGMHVYRGRWRKDYASRPAPTPNVGFTSPSAQARSLHGYIYPSLTNPAASPSLSILGHLEEPVGPAQFYWDFTTGTQRDTHTGGAVPATFLNIDGRCFIADGAREGFIADDRTPAIHQQKNQNLGIGTPTQALQNIAGNITGSGTGYLHLNSPYLNHPNPNNKLGTILITDQVELNLLDSATYLYDPGTGLPTTDVPAVAGVSSNTTPFTASGTISITTGTSLVTLTGTTWPANFQYAGLAINFNGYSFVIRSHGDTVGLFSTDINGTLFYLSNTQLLILGVYDGPTVTAVPYTITGCQVKLKTNNAYSTVNTNPAVTPPSVALGYSQGTAGLLVQVRVTATRNGSTGLLRNLGNISLGDEDPNPSNTETIRTITDAHMHDGSHVLTSGTTPFVEADVGAPIFVDDAGPTALLATTIDYFYNSSQIRLTEPNSSGASVTGKAWWGANPMISDGAAAGGGDNTFTSASNPFVPGDVGQTIVVEDGVAANNALITTIASYNSAGSVELTVAAAAISGKRAWWRGISTSVHEGPTYAYAWYDPETGHMSNISPTFKIPKPTDPGNYVDFANMTPFFQIDNGSISYPSGVDALRFSHIVFFRTLSTPGSSTLYPIGSLQPFVGKVHPGLASTRGSWNPSTYRGWMGLPNNYTAAPPVVTGPNYWYDFSSDEDLILTGGFRAPQYTNEKPMVLIRGGLTEPGKVAHQAYWDRRLWVVCTQDPDKIQFSCDEAQCPLGVPVESFPPTNFLRIPSVDGRVVGMKTVGDMLLITTDRWAYTIAGNNESNYRLLRVSTRMGGVGTHQMSEITSDVEGQSSIVYFLGRDKILYEWVVGGAVTPISDPVQDELNSKLTSLFYFTNARVHCVSAWARRLVVVTFGYYSPDAWILIFDINNRTWSVSQLDDGSNNYLSTPGALTTVYGMDPPVNEIFAARDYNDSTVFIRSWLRDDGPVQGVNVFGNAGQGYIATFPLNFDGLKTRKQIVMVNAHVSADTGGTYYATVNVNEAGGGVKVMEAYPDNAYSVYGATPTPVDSPNAKDLVALTAEFKADNSALVGYRFWIGILTTSTSQPTEIYAIDIGYVDWEEPGEGDP